MDGENLSFDNGISHTNADVTEKDNDNAENRSAFARLESPQEMIGHLRDELAMANAEILRLKAKVNEYELSFVQEDIVNQRNELLKLLFQRDNTIERKSMEINILEKQLEAAVTAKFEALARLDANGGNELTDLTISLTNNEPEIMAEKQRRKRNNSDNTVDTARQTKRSRKHSTKADDNLEATTLCHLGHKDVVDSEVDQVNMSTSREKGNDSIRIQNELLSEVRTRRQNQFVLDAFSKTGDSEASEGVNQDLITKNGQKISDRKPPRSSNNAQNHHRHPFVKLKKMKLSF